MGQLAIRIASLLILLFGIADMGYANTCTYKRVSVKDVCGHFASVRCDSQDVTLHTVRARIEADDSKCTNGQLIRGPFLFVRLRLDASLSRA